MKFPLRVGPITQTLWTRMSFSTNLTTNVISIYLLPMTLTGLYSLFQHALRLLAFGQLYKVLHMDPLPACKPSPRLLEGVCSSVCCLHVQRMCVSSVPV